MRYIGYSRWRFVSLVRFVFESLIILSLRRRRRFFVSGLLSRLRLRSSVLGNGSRSLLLSVIVLIRILSRFMFRLSSLRLSLSLCRVVLFVVMVVVNIFVLIGF